MQLNGGEVQSTINAPLEFSGVGLHTGEMCAVRIRPARTGSGIIFRRIGSSIDINGSKHSSLIQASPENVIQTYHGTTLANDYGLTIATVEHLMAALAICAVDNALIEVYGAEAPILDGSAAEFVEGIKATGLRELSESRREIVVTEPIFVESGDRHIKITPADHFSLDISIAFEDCMIGRQSLSIHLDDAGTLDRLAKSRTFCRLFELEGLRKKGLIRGGSFDNSIVVDGSRLLNDEALRDPAEFALHKALDLIGDLYLLGAPVRGAIRANKPGHDLNIRAALAIARQGQPQAGLTDSAAIAATA